MNGVLGMARLLMETKLHPEQRTYAEAIQQSGVALLSLIEDILDFSKIESGTVTLEEDEIEPRQIVEGVVELLAPRAHAKGIELVAVISPDAPELIRIDGIRLRQVLTNLVGNAIKFTERGGVRVHMRVIEDRERRFLRFEVRDTGVGVPAEKRVEIFEEFVQADSVMRVASVDRALDLRSPNGSSGPWAAKSASIPRPAAEAFFGSRRPRLRSAKQLRWKPKGWQAIGSPS